VRDEGLDVGAGMVESCVFCARHGWGCIWLGFELFVSLYVRELFVNIGVMGI